MFFDRLDTETLALANPDKGLYDAFAVRRGGWRVMFSWASQRAGCRARTNPVPSRALPYQNVRSAAYSSGHCGPSLRSP